MLSAKSLVLMRRLFKILISKDPDFNFFIHTSAS